MRLYPSLPTGGNRKTSSDEGITVNGIFIPPETTIVGPRFVIARRMALLDQLYPESWLIRATGEDCFIDANLFVPERWTTRPEMVRNRTATVPFGIGRSPRPCLCFRYYLTKCLLGHRTCLGKVLAMNDMMLITAHIVRKYRFRFPIGESGDAVYNDWTDQFTTHLGRLRLIFEEREN